VAVISQSHFVTSCIQEATFKDSNFAACISISSLKEEIASIMSSITPSPLSKQETLLFHSGLPSGPPLIARTGAPWKQPGGPEAYPHKRKLLVVGKHPIAVPGLWRDQVGPKLLDILDQFNVKWHTIDVARIAYEDSDDNSCAPPVVWIAVELGTLSGNEGDTVAHQCQEVLVGFDLNDVEVCIRGSKHHWEAAPTFEAPASDVTAKLCMPFTSAIGFPLSTKVCPTTEGSLGLFFINGSDISTIYFLTARHVLFPPTTRNANKLHDCKNTHRPPHDVTIFSEKGINDHLKDIRIHIGEVGMPIKHHQSQIDRLERREDEVAVKECKKAQAEIRKAQKGLEKLEKLYEDRFKFWHSTQGRTIGFITLSPPIAFSVGSNQYMEDWAIGQVDTNKINIDTFCPNVLDLGFEFTPEKLNSLMYPIVDLENPPSFQYPEDRLLQIHGVVSDTELQNPSDKDENGNPCIIVLKRGKTTGLTVGCVNNLNSFVRTYWKDGTADTSMELPVFGHKSKNEPFSEPGDSGSIVVDGKGHVIGIITGGVGFTTSSDVTYVAPAEFIFNQIRGHKINPNINFTLKATM
jgi:hypothetical protein